MHERLAPSPTATAPLLLALPHQQRALSSDRPVRTRCWLPRGDRPEARLDKLVAVLSEATDTLAEVAPLVAALLGISTAKRYPPLASDPEAGSTTFDALVDQVEGLATRRRC